MIDGEAEDWMIKGECRKHDPELWFSRLQNATGTRKAKLLCKALCPVREECLLAVCAEVRQGS